MVRGGGIKGADLMSSPSGMPLSLDEGEPTFTMTTPWLDQLSDMREVSLTCPELMPPQESDPTSESFSTSDLQELERHIVLTLTEHITSMETRGSSGSATRGRRSAYSTSSGAMYLNRSRYRGFVTNTLYGCQSREVKFLVRYVFCRISHVILIF